MRATKIHRLSILAAFLAWGAAIPIATTAQERKPLAVEDALRTKEFGALLPIALSPDGSELAYTVQDNGRARTFGLGSYDRSGVPPWGIAADIWIENIVSGVARNLTGGQGDNWLPAWSPDGHYLAFFSSRDGGKARLWVWDAQRDALTKVTDADVRGNQIVWTRDSEHLLTTTLPAALSSEDYVRKISADEKFAGRTANAANGPTAVVYRSTGRSDAGKPEPTSDPWNLDRNLRDLDSIDVRSREMKALVRGTRITTFSLSPDGSQVAFTIPKRFEKDGSQQILFDLAVAQIRGGKEAVLASDIRLEFSGDRFRWSPDSRQIAYCESGPRVGGDCYVAQVEGKRPENITGLASSREGDFSGSVAPLWDAPGRSVFFLHRGALWRADASGSKAVQVAEIPGRRITALIPRSENLLWTSGEGTSTVVVTHDEAGKQDGFYRVDLRNGEATRLREDGECYTCTRATPGFSVSPNGRSLVYFAEDAQHSADLWVSDADFLSPRRLTHLNPQFDAYRMGAAQLIHWLSDDGEPLQGTLLLPSDCQPGVRYPLIVWVYGGLLQSDSFDHFGLAATGPFNMQLLATRGYAVLLPDMPLGVGSPMQEIAKTVLPGVNKVIEMGLADPQRLGVMGHSFGGYSTLALLVETNRFHAAIDASGFADLITNYAAMRRDGTAFGISIAEQGPGSLGGTPWTVRDRYIANSPVFYLDRIETPLLILQGGEDVTVDPFLAGELFVDLRRLGKEAEYARYDGEGHSPLYWSYANQVDFCNRVIAWFDMYLKPAPKH
jgi:dipeptidyl aminopeptidase/acylaminoacyl peptidase